MRAAGPALENLARPSGAFAMVAIDQRESLRTMLAERAGAVPAAIPDSALAAFKVAAARVLSPAASAILVDRLYGLAPIRRADALDRRCALIVACDRLLQAPGAPVEETELDEELDPEAALAAGAVALKLLIIWRADGGLRRRLAMATSFVERCRAVGLISILEAVTRPGGGEWSQPRAVVDAARQLGAVGPDLYKAEVPFHGDAPPDAVAEAAAEVTAALDCRWVVLSQGVPADAFAAAVAAACRGGASGFLAGRAIWSEALGPEDELEPVLRARSLPRLMRLARLVDRVARPVGTRAPRAPRPRA